VKPQRGAAKDITLELSGCIEDSSGFVLSDLRYMREGIPFLGPDERIRCLWDHIDRLIPYLRERRLQEGAAVKVSYKGLPGEAYATEWRIDPLLYEGLRYMLVSFPEIRPILCHGRRSSRKRKAKERANRREVQVTKTGVREIKCAFFDVLGLAGHEGQTKVQVSSRN
jgi:hypothetical protein